MSYSATVYNVMIVSPSDVNIYRNKVRDIIHDWNDLHSESLGTVLSPLGWESHTHPEMGGSAQSIINRQILEKCDLLVAIFWTRLGTSTEGYNSGSVEEIERHLAAGKPAMIYFCREPVPYQIAETTNQLQELATYKSKCASAGLLQEFTNIEEFIHKFERHLHRCVVDGFHLELPRLVAKPTEQNRPAHITGFRFKGNTAITEKELEEIITSDKNTLLSSTNVDTDVKRIQELYRRQGYAALVTDVDHEKDGTLTFTIQEGSVSKIQIHGLNRVQESTVRDMIFTRPQDKFNEQQIQGDLNRIYALGSFSDVSYRVSDDPDIHGALVITVVVKEKSLLSQLTG